MIDKSNLAKRLLFALPAIPVGWWFINSTLSITAGVPALPPILPGHILVLALTVGAGLEYTRMLGIFFPKNAFWLSSVWIAALLVFDMIGFVMPLKFSIFILLFIIACEAVFLGEKNTGRWKRASLLFSGTVFLYIAGISCLNLYQDPFQSFFVSYGAVSPMLSQMGIVTVVSSILLCDTLAYFFGSLFGRRRFSNISPNKTIEGAFAGFFTAVLAYTVCWYFFGSPHYPRFLGVFMGLCVGVFAQVGDLFVSLMKRYFKVKNASDIFPGHGGILDRFGSVFFAVPTLGLFIWIVNKLVG
jgi:phosphatidate cytidylyltransferase